MKRMMMALAGAMLAAGCASTGGTGSRAKDAGTTFGRDALQPYVDRGELSGAICVFYKDGWEETTCVGYADVEAKRPIRMDDPFRQCSQTKGFCGVAVAILVDDGKLKLDDPVSKYLPEFKTLWVEQSNSNGVRTLVKAKNALTVRMCLNHTGGFAFEVPAKNPAIRGGGWSGGMPLRSAAAEAAALPLRYEPGTDAGYSNLGIDIGAAVVEVASGMSFEDFLRTRVFEPLGMTDTTFKPTDEQLSHMVEIYGNGPKGKIVHQKDYGQMQRPFNDAHVFPSAGAGLWSTARDQLKFYKMLMNLGLGENGVRILKEETVFNILAKSTRPPELINPSKGICGYSMGLSASVEEADTWFGHTGALGTNAGMNWKDKEMYIWVVQSTGNGGWSAAWQKAKDDFCAHIAKQRR